MSEDLDPRQLEDEVKTGPVEGLVMVVVSEQEPTRVLKLGENLSNELKEELTCFLKANLDAFTWTHEHMVRIHLDVICHRLNISPDFKLILQKMRAMDAERYKAFKDEVDKLLDIGFIRESFYPSWLANPVLVKKSNDKWRTCVDFTDLNKACPKDSFPLSRNDQLVDATTGHELLNFMDRYSGYNQIPMYLLDEEHTSFIIDRGLYCYKVMPFGLKNAGATYQRMVDMMFTEQIGQNIEVYVDDMLVKSKLARDHIQELDQMFKVLCRY